MKKLTLTLLLLFSLGCPSFRAEKHTGPCSLIFVGSESRFWFIRPNKEMFEMYFDNPPEVLKYTRDFNDIVYVDDGPNYRHFIKAVLK